MKNFYGPCYTLAEAQEKLAMNTSELRFLIEKKEIQCVVYSKLRKFLLFSIENDNRWAGAGTCDYHGHYTLHYSYVRNLLDIKSITIGKGYGRLLELEGIQAYSSKYPFRKNIPHGILTGWDVKELQFSDLTKLLTCPLPEEQIPALATIKYFGDIVQQITGTSGSSDASNDYYSVENLDLNFTNNSKFEPEDLRIPLSEINKFKDIGQAINMSVPTSPSSTTERESQLNTLVEKILNHHPGIKNLQIWNLIEEDSKLDDPLFDTDNILVCVDAHGIEWESRKGKSRSLKRTSFDPLVSKIRRRLKSKNSIRKL